MMQTNTHVCRYLSHFRSIHRGAYFAELRTTAVRKLLPESWGFMCPVHTPDGSPCGLLNHLTTSCIVVPAEPSKESDVEAGIVKVLSLVGLVQKETKDIAAGNDTSVLLDGKYIGCIQTKNAAAAVSFLRNAKASKLATEIGAPFDKAMDPEVCSRIPSDLEIAHFPYKRGGIYSGIYLFSQGARMMRPVRQRASKATELIGSLEQSVLSIHCPDGIEGGSKGLKFTHEEFSPEQMLSVVASLTPYSDFNQSPRNMYQCQMAKQTMGTAAQALPHRTDNKLYRLQTPQTPIVRTQRYPKYSMDEFPNGTNAIVAVLAYTGYDMEDAMILNKSSVERGFAHASLYKTESINLSKEKGATLKFASSSRKEKPKEPPKGAFGAEFPRVPVDMSKSFVDPHIIDADGLPRVGAPVWTGETYYNAVDTLTGKGKSGKLKGEETAVIDQVAIVGHGKSKDITHANIKLRFNRNPVIGDKFSSRHGQKGVLSRLYDDVDMPFSESSGMRPDLLINPHAFPSRMTIGMLIESLTGKSGALQGSFVDSSPFQKCREDSNNNDSQDGLAICREFCEALESAGFCKNGGETMVCGVSGEIFQVDTYIGVVYYQRLRHMVSDKFQVRSTGPINPMTRQPIKGRKFGGGIRFGEMERDSLLAHGAAYLLHDRLHSCSDYHVTDICSKCGLLVSTQNVPHTASTAHGVHATKVDAGGKGRVVCRLCESSANVERVAVPYVFKYLVSELAAMNIRCSLDLKI
jgi:DNA-directed RNA polymerase I subunit RPA2